MGQDSRGWNRVVAVSWLEPGPIGSRSGSRSLFDKFELFLWAGAPLRNRTV